MFFNTFENRVFLNGKQFLADVFEHFTRKMTLNASKVAKSLDFLQFLLNKCTSIFSGFRNKLEVQFRKICPELTGDIEVYLGPCKISMTGL